VDDRCDPSLTRVNPSALEMSIAHIIKSYTNVPFILLTYWSNTNRYVDRDLARRAVALQ